MCLRWCMWLEDVRVCLFVARCVKLYGLWLLCACVCWCVCVCFIFLLCGVVWCACFVCCLCLCACVGVVCVVCDVFYVVGMVT